MANPFLPLWEYIPDGEPRVFGDRVYIYGSHDRPSCEFFCDYRLKVWSAPVDDLENWQCHGVSFRTRNGDEPGDVPWTDRELYAPDVVEKDGKFYLYSYIVGSKGAAAVSDRPEGPFILLGQYICDDADAGDDGVFNDPGVLVDDDGSVYIYYGFERSHFGQIDPGDMRTVIKGSYMADLIPPGSEQEDFFEASSPRKIGGRYYLIYSPRKGSQLSYAISDSPKGPFKRMGPIIDNGEDYPGGNDHGSLCCIGGQWYIFYHRMTNGSIMSRRACVERVQILPDGTIPKVEMTSLGFSKSLDPYKETPAEIACVLRGGCLITEKDVLTREVTSIKTGAVIGYRYFDFGEDFSGSPVTLCLKTTGRGMISDVHVILDDPGSGQEVGVCRVEAGDGIFRAKLPSITGRHAVFFRAEHIYKDWWSHCFNDRELFGLVSFVFLK